MIGFDLHKDAPDEALHRVELVANQKGLAVGVMRWLRMDFGGGIVFENRPPQHSTWHPQLHILPFPQQVVPGDSVIIEVFHKRKQLFIIPPSAKQ